MLWLMFGIPKLLVELFNRDVGIFWRSLFKYVDNQEKFDVISLIEIKIMKTTLKKIAQ